MTLVTRFAPSPTGYLHLGHAYSALQAFRAAKGGVFLLRIEDIDKTRCKPEFAEALVEDLHWLGLSWPEPVRRQSEHRADYAAALGRLREMGLVYPCFCTRREIEQEAERAGVAPHADDGTIAYPGTCRAMPEGERMNRLSINIPNWRLNVAEAVKRTGRLYWRDRSRGKIEAYPEIFGDVVLARKDFGTSYHLSVVVDDHLQGVTLVTRGEDLIGATDIHCLLQKLLGFETPEYNHHKLVTDAAGKRYAKRDQAVTLRALRQIGITPDEVLKQISC